MPRVTDVNEALAVISKTPLLEFKVEGEKDAPLNLNISPEDLKNGKLPTINTDELVAAAMSILV